MEKDDIIILIVASAIVLTLIGLSIAIWKQRDKRKPVQVVDTRHQKRGRDGWLTLFIVTYKDGHTAEEWVDVSSYKYEIYHNWNASNSESAQEYNLEHELKMKIDLRKIFNLLRPKIVLLLLLSILLIVIGVVVGYGESIILGILTAIFALVSGLFPYSKFLKVDGEGIKYRVFRRRFVGYGVGLHGEHHKKYEDVYREAVGKIETVEFRQNIIEKIFNAGHLNFIEDGTTNKHSVYGITNFDKRKQEIERIFKTYYF